MRDFKYILVGGKPFKTNSGVVSYSTLRVIGVASDENELCQIITDNYDKCNGLFLAIDAETGLEAKDIPFGSITESVIVDEELAEAFSSSEEDTRDYSRHSRPDFHSK